MTRTRFRWALTTLKLTPEEFAADIGMPVLTVKLWRSGRRTVPKIVQQLLESWTRIQRLEAKERRPR